MRASIGILSGTVVGMIVWGAAIAAPAAPPPERNCQTTGGEVSALIDIKGTSPNIAAARAIFQVGIMDCMEGDDATANRHYQDAKTLLTNEQKLVPAKPVKPAVPVPVVAEDCQKLGGEVSALIDTKGTSPNLSRARAIFQTGIMDCMEGDDGAANKRYLEAKNLLSGDR